MKKRIKIKWAKLSGHSTYSGAIFWSLALILGLSACDKSIEVQLGPKTDSRIQSGESAKRSLIHQKDLRLQEQALEKKLQDWITDASRVRDDQRRHVTLIKSPDSCEILIEDALVTNEQVVSALLTNSGEMRECANITIIATKVYVPAGQVLSTSGRNLTIFADVIDLQGTISTDAIPAPENQAGLNAGDLRIYALSFDTFPSALITARGGDAGVFVHRPVKISNEAVSELQKKARLKGVKLETATTQIKSIKVDGPTPPSIANAYSLIKGKAKQYLEGHHPGYTGNPPNPFSGGGKRIKAGDIVYFWRLKSEQILNTPQLKKSFSVSVPGLPSFNRPGGSGGLIEVFVASPKKLVQPKIENSRGSDQNQDLSKTPEWELNQLKQPIAIHHKNQVRYTFELWQRPGGRSEDQSVAMSWQETVSRLDGKKSHFAPALSINPPQVSDEETLVTHGEQNPSVLYRSSEIGFIDTALEKTRLSVSDLPKGLASYRDWSAEWLKLQETAKREGILLRQ